MNIPGYDAWKLAGPDDDAQICPFCGVTEGESCESDPPDSDCQWEQSKEDEDPDYLRDRANEDRDDR